MAFALSKELTEAEWKKHKAAMASGTNVSDKLRVLTGVAAKYDANVKATVTNLKASLEDVRTHAEKTAKGLSPAFAGTKKALEAMVKAATAHLSICESQLKRHQGLEDTVAANKKLRTEYQQKIVSAAGTNMADFTKALLAGAQILELKPAAITAITNHIRAHEEGKAQAILKNFSIEIPLGALMKLRMGLEAKKT